MRRLGDLFFLFLFFALLVLFFPALARAEAEDPLADMDIEQLMEVEVVTASRRAEPLTQVAGAVTVLTKEDIFRSGATNIPEALKLVPGVHVSQVDTDKWAVGIRGFNGLLSHKHLVLLDGRPMTSPDMGGVSWGNTIPSALSSESKSYGEPGPACGAQSRLQESSILSPRLQQSVRGGRVGLWSARPGLSKLFDLATSSGIRLMSWDTSADRIRVGIG